MIKYQYKIISCKYDKNNERNFDINEVENTEWDFVAFIEPNAMLFKKTIQKPEHTFTVPDTSGTHTPNTVC